jgi:hypothetical protein
LQQQNKFVHGNDESTRDITKDVKVVNQIKDLHTKTTEVLAAHRSIMFVTIQDDASTREQKYQDEMHAYLQTKMTNYLQNWVNTWKPAIEASIKSPGTLSVNTMGCIDDHFCYLVLPPKRPPRS